MLQSRCSNVILLPVLAAAIFACSADDDSMPADLGPEDLRSAPADGLELHWSFEARSGTTIYDLSGNGRNGTLSGGSFVSSPWGDAVSLDGVDDYISFVGPRDPDDFGGASTGAFTISARVKVDDAGRYNTLCWGCAPNALLSVGTSSFGDRLYGSIHKPSNDTKTFPMSDNGSVSDDTWTLVTLVVEAGVGTKYYIDCQHNETVNESDSGLKDYGYSRVGEGFDSNSYFDGQIDDLKVWSRALSATEIAGLCPCDADPLATTLGIEPPRAPQPNPNTPQDDLVLPDDALTIEEVDNTTDLQALVTTPGLVEDIVLADGTYTTTGLTGTYLTVRGLRIWAKNPGKAILKFAINTGGNSSDFADAELHGLVFDIDDPTYTVNDAVISNWNDAENLTIEDCVIHANDNAKYGIRVTNSAEGFEGRRLEIDGATDYGITIGVGDDNFHQVVLEDVRVWDIDSASVSTAGVGIRVLEPVNLSRIHVRDVRWSGLVINGDSNGSVLVDIDVDQVGASESTGRVGVYFDDTAEGCTLSQFCVGPSSQDGVRSEWDHLSVSNCKNVDPQDTMAWEACLAMYPTVHPKGIDNVVEDGLIQSERMGVSFDQGTVNGTVDNVTFRNQSFSAIMFYKNVSSVMQWPVYDDGSTQTNNTFEECGVCALTFDHPNNGTPTCQVNGPSC